MIQLIGKKKCNEYLLCFIVGFIFFFISEPSISLGKQLIIVPPLIECSASEASEEIVAFIYRDYQKAIDKLKKELNEAYAIEWDLVIYLDIESFYKNFEQDEKIFLANFMKENGSASLITVIFCKIAYISSENSYQVNSFGYLDGKNLLLQSYLPRILIDPQTEIITYQVYLSLFFDILNQGGFLVEGKL